MNEKINNWSLKVGWSEIGDSSLFGDPEKNSEGGITRYEEPEIGVRAFCSMPCVWFILLGNQFRSSFQFP